MTCILFFVFFYSSKKKGFDAVKMLQSLTLNVASDELHSKPSILLRAE